MDKKYYNMKIIRNKYIPFKGFRAINIFGVLFVRGNAKIDNVTIIGIKNIKNNEENRFIKSTNSND